MNLPHITFRKVWPARSYGYRDLAHYPPNEPDAGAPALPLRGGFSNTRPASRGVIDSRALNSGRDFVVHADELETGPIPSAILRQTTARNAGTISAASPRVGMVGWPYDGNFLRIPHQYIPRTPITVTPFVRTFDQSVTIPSIYIGGPVK